MIADNHRISHEKILKLCFYFNIEMELQFIFGLDIWSKCVVK